MFKKFKNIIIEYNSISDYYKQQVDKWNIIFDHIHEVKKCLALHESNNNTLAKKKESFFHNELIKMSQSSTHSKCPKKYTPIFQRINNIRQIKSKYKFSDGN